MTLATFIQLLIGGVSIGALYALPALGISLIWNAAGVFNFANGEFVMIACFLVWTFFTRLKWPFIVALLLALGFMFFFGIITERTIVRTLRRQNAPPIKVLVSFIALSIFLRNAARFVWGTMPRTVPNAFGTKPIEILSDVYIMPHTLWILGIAVSVMILLFVMFRYTMVGIAMRATTQNRNAAALMGVNTNAMVSLVFGLSSAVAALTGALSGAVFFITLEMGVMFSTKAFTANIIGGFGNPVGAVIGGLILGVVETLGASFISSQYKDVITFTLLLFFLLFRPRGLFKLEIVEKV
ncbi:MAG TPA: branched-chain amino acid ABC transporter permease [Firmicutes bacterium]|nr:branched-chain amino acid ABC transporter permease [Bacillota bacterium]